MNQSRFLRVVPPRRDANSAVIKLADCARHAKGNETTRPREKGVTGVAKNTDAAPMGQTYGENLAGNKPNQANGAAIAGERVHEGNAGPFKPISFASFGASPYGRVPTYKNAGSSPNLVKFDVSLTDLSEEPSPAVPIVEPPPTDTRPDPAPRRENRATRRSTIKAGIDLSGDGYLLLHEVLSVYPVSRALWYDMVKRKILPAPISLGKRRVGWSRAAIRELVANPPKF